MIRHCSKPRFRVSILRSRWSSKSRTSTRGFRGCLGRCQTLAYGVPGDPELFIQRMQEFYEEQTNVVTDARVGMTLTAFRGIAQAVAGLPGRKSLVWVSGAFPMATYSRVIQYSANPNNDPNRVRIENLYEDKLRETDSILTDAQ